ncbi:MAG: hypothetical protein CVV58_00525 [Tenericutes bacterium HGW-Tenericutes-3]|nr:MAG: hypothetical protein CVV58_00525 [Tenericutes bacterium HGW-Tenericutes-3]
MGDKMNLNEEQKRVVYSNERFLFLLASAGSGKTRVIIERIKYLIGKGVNPRKMLAITFTRKAAHEMRDRANNQEINIHTFHQFCYIRLSELKQKTIQIVDEDALPFSRTEILEISKYKNSIYQISKPKGYDAYQDYLNKQDLKDFDDLLLDYYYILKTKKNVMDFEYIFIDEFQDTNNLQYQVLKLLINGKTSVLAVGDPDQSIYQFRGANSKIIYRYIKDYQAKLYSLTINYRSSQTIITHANRLIKRNNRRYQKQLIPNDESKHPVYHLRFSSVIEETLSLIELIRTLKKIVKKDHEIAILFRNYERSYEIRKGLYEYDILFRNSDEEFSNNQIQLMTIHKAKGLEFDAVIIIGLEQGLLPSSIQNSQMILDEERRLMFVAMTRARKYLYLSSVASGNQNHTFNASQFIRESGVKTIKNKRLNDIISLGETNGH